MVSQTTPAQGERRVVLIVDDDDDIRETLREVLEDEGYSATTAMNGREALDRLDAGLKPDVILLDLMMPVMNGWQFREVQRADPRWANVPVIVISASGGARHAAEPLDAAVVLNKPVALDRLLDELARCVA